MNKYVIHILLGFLVNTIFFYKCLAQSESNFEMSYFEDVSSIHSFESIKETTFKVTPEKIVSLGITKSTIWVKIKLNKTLLHSDVVLEVNRAFLDEITLSYSTLDNLQEMESLGVMYSQSKNKLNHFVPAFIIPTNKLDSPEIYLKIKSRWSMLIPVSIKTKEAFYKERVNVYFIGALLIGGLLLMAIYNLFLFFSTRDSSYILYVLALLCAILSQGYIFGILIPYLSPESPEFSFRFPVIVMALTGLFSTWFTLQFLEIKRTDGFIYAILIFAIILPLFSISLELLKLDYLSRKINIIQIILLSLIIFSAGIYSLIKGNKIALYFTIGWSFYLTGMVVFALKTIGILPHNNFTEHFMHIGTFMEVMLLSFALGHKYYLVRVEKERLERQTRDELEELVKTQTTKLKVSLEEKEILLKEVHHRVKNNLQIVISLLDLQVASIKEPKNKEILIQSKSRVYSMSLIHQKLYQSDNLASVNMKNYLEELFTYVQHSYYNVRKKTTYTVLIDNRELSLTKAVPLGLIVNELLTNSFKYGLETNVNNQINMSLFFGKKKLELIIADSGFGFDENDYKQDVKKSLGLFLVKSLIKQLRGSISRYNSEGLFITELIIPIND